MKIYKEMNKIICLWQEIFLFLISATESQLPLSSFTLFLLLPSLEKEIILTC